MTDYSKITALYSRLSVGDEDRDGGESNSIPYICFYRCDPYRPGTHSQPHHLQLHRIGQYPEIPGFFVIRACGAAAERPDLSGTSAFCH